MLSKKHLLIVLLGLVLLISAGSVSSQSGSQLPVDVPRESVFVVDQILRYPAPLNFNLWVPGQHPANHHALMYETLWYIDQETGERINALATEQPIYNDDFTEMTVNLRDGIFWSDGVEFSAADLVFTIETIMATPGMNWNPVLTRWVESVEQTEDNTVVFHLVEPNNRFHYNFEPGWNGVYMMPKHVFETVDDLLTYDNNPPLSLSAYEFVEGDAQGFWELYQRREDWERTFVGMKTGKPGPEYILTIFYGGSERKAIAMARHELDIFFDLDKEAFGAVLDSTPTARPWYQEFPWAYPNEIDARYLGFNQQGNPYLQNRDVRWGLTLALNIVEMETQYLGGVARITAIPQPATSALMELYHNPMEEWLTNLQIDLGDGEMYNPYDPTVPDQVAAWAVEQGYNIGDDARALFGTGWWKHDPEAAAKLMEKAGFSRNGDGLWLTPDGEVFTLILSAPSDEPDAYSIALAAADQWTEFGVTIDLQASQRSLWEPAANIGQFDVLSAWSRGIPNTIINGDKWSAVNGNRTDLIAPLGEPYNSTGGSNILRIENPEFDRIADDLLAVSPVDPAAIELGQEYAQIFVEEMYAPMIVSFKKFITVDTQYWTGFPTSTDPTYQPLYWFMGGKFFFSQLEPTN